MTTNFVVVVKPGEPIDKAIRQFSRLFIKSGTRRIYFQHSQFTSPSELRARRNERYRRRYKQKKP